MEIYYTAYIHYFDCTNYLERLCAFDGYYADLASCFIACELDGKVRYLFVPSSHTFSAIKTEEFPYPCTIIKQNEEFHLNLINK